MPLDYYDNPGNWGNYQFINLSEVIDRIMLESIQDDSYISGLKRSSALSYAKNIIRSYEILNRTRPRSYSFTLPPTYSNQGNLLFPFPADYVEYSGVFVVHTDLVTGGKHLEPLDLNRNINISKDFLQDDTGEILLDNDGYVLESDGENAYGKPYIKYRYRYSNCGSQFTRDTSKLSKFGEFNEDKERGTFVFSSNLSEKDIVIVYVTDGLDNQLLNGGDIKIHKAMSEMLYTGIYSASIEGRRTCPANEKYRARQRYKAERHNCNKIMSGLDLKELSRVMRQLTMQP